jgi:hypothetical protein
MSGNAELLVYMQIYATRFVVLYKEGDMVKTLFGLFVADGEANIIMWGSL